MRIMIIMALGLMAGLAWAETYLDGKTPTERDVNAVEARVTTAESTNTAQNTRLATVEGATNVMNPIVLGLNSRSSTWDTAASVSAGLNTRSSTWDTAASVSAGLNGQSSTWANGAAVVAANSNNWNAATGSVAVTYGLTNGSAYRGDWGAGISNDLALYLLLTGGTLSGELVAPSIRGTWVTNVAVVTTQSVYVGNTVAGYTLTTNNFAWNRDGAWHPISFTGSVPVGATAIWMSYLFLTTNTAGAYLEFGDMNSNIYVSSFAIVPNVVMAMTGMVPLDANRNCLYNDGLKVSSTFGEYVTVTGWWIPQAITNTVTIKAP